MRPDSLSDRQLAERVRAGAPGQDIVDEYYRRCIPHYLDFIGMHWHTGLYTGESDDVSPRDQERMIDHLADLAGIGAGHSVLDVGCGIGATLVYLAGTRGIRGAGLTPVSGQRDLARELARRSGVEEVLRFDPGHAAALPYADASFDHVLFLESPCHFPDRAAFFREAWRVLKPGGSLCGEDWLRAEGINDTDAERWLDPIARTWAMPALGSGSDYCDAMQAAGFAGVSLRDAREISELERGFCVSPESRAELQEEIGQCQDPVWALTLEGLSCLGEALEAGAFTIGIFHAGKP